jgi:hypothetical protein
VKGERKGKDEGLGREEKGRNFRRRDEIDGPHTKQIDATIL